MDVLMLPPLMAVDSSNRFPEIKTHVKQVASYISFLFNTFYFNTWISSFDRWLILLTFTICTRRACRVDLYFQIGPRHKLTSETVKGHSPHMAQHGWIYHCRAARCMRQARAVPAYKTHPQLLIFAAVKKSAPYTRVFTVNPFQHIKLELTISIVDTFILPNMHLWCDFL